MKKAILNGKVVSAKFVAELSEGELSGCRTHFKCIDCKANAYFNKGSSKQTPYFAAKNHADGCDEAYFGASGGDDKLVEAGTLVIHVDAFGATSDEGQARNTGGSPNLRTVVLGAGAASNTSATRGVRAVLRELINRPEFATSAKNIVVWNKTVRASEFFVPFDQLGDPHIDRPVGVWGVLFSGREGGAIAWLNRGDQKVSIEVPIQILDELKTIYKFANASELQGARFLLIGSFNLHLQCRINDARQIAFRLVKPSI